MEVLIVDDDPVAIELLQHVLKETGYDVLTAENGLEAMTILRNSTCRMVISDWEMPEMDGIELCRAIRTENLGRYIYIILLTGKEGTSHVIEGLSAGADNFVSKPFEPAELNVRLHTGKRILSLETRDMAIFALAKLAESRDPETGAHLERVRGYSKALAENLAGREKFADCINGEFIQLMYLASPLHDIGKVAIPDHVLLKPGRLDDREFEIMKTHATAGAVTLDSALQQYPEAKFLQMARDIAAYHHERYDGDGYMAGLAGEDIPLCARIFSIADVYDALVSKRVYKKAFTHDVAKSIIVEGSGTQFDSDVVDAFLQEEDKFQEIAELQKDDIECEAVAA